MFVGRKRELEILDTIRKNVEKGQGSLVIIEGAAGIGKSALVKQFSGMLNSSRWHIRETKARFEERYTPYSVFTAALGIKSIRDVMEELNKKLAEELANEIKNEKAMMFFESSRSSILRRVCEMIDDCLIISPMRRDGIFLTELDVEGGVKPYLIESELMDNVIRYAKNREKPTVAIENVNYLFEVADQKKVIYFLKDLSSILKNGSFLITGRLDLLQPEARKAIENMFEIITVEAEGSEGDTLLLTPLSKIDDAVVFSDGEDGDYTVSESTDLRPSMLNFALLDKILDTLKNSNIMLKCLRTLIDYNDLKSVYVWLKYIRDSAMIYGKKVYVNIQALTHMEIAILETLSDGYIFPGETEGKYAVYEAFVRYLNTFSRRKNLLIVIEDIQWIDENSMDLLAYLARNIPRNTMIIVTYRGEEVALSERARGIYEVRDYENVYFLRLGPLKREDALLLLKNIGSDKAEEIYERSGGNPLLMLEMARYENESPYLPDTIMESIEMQINMLDDTTLYYLRFLSVFGSQVDSDAATSLLGTGWIASLKNRENLMEINHRVKFRSSVVWEYIYKSTPPDLRREFHVKIGSYYAERDIFKAAYHFYMARTREGIEYLLRAARESRDMYALENAINFYRMALEISEKYRLGDITEDILEKLADLEELTGRYKDALKDYKKLLRLNFHPRVLWKTARCLAEMGEHELAEEYLKKVMESDDEIMKKRATETWGNLHLRRGEFEKAERYLREFLNYALESGDRVLISHGYSSLATLKFHQSRYVESLEFAKKAMEIAQETGEYNQLIAIYNLLGVIYDVLGKPEKALEKYQMLLELSKRAGDLRGMAMAYNNIGILHYSLGDINSVKEHLEKAMELHLKMGDVRSLALSYYNLSGVYSDLGDYHTGKEYAQKALNIYRKLGDTQHVAFSELWIGLYSMWMGNYSEGLNHIKNSLKVAERENYQKLLFMAKIALARTYRRMNNLKEYRKVIEELRLLADTMKNDADAYPEYLLTLSEFYLYTGDLENASRYIREMKEVSEKLQNEYMRGVSFVMMAILNAMRGNHDDTLFNEGIKIFKRQGLKSIIAESYYDYGRILLKRGHLDGKEYLKRAMEMFKDMRLDIRVQEVLNLLQ